MTTLSSKNTKMFHHIQVVSSFSILLRFSYIETVKLHLHRVIFFSV